MNLGFVSTEAKVQKRNAQQKQVEALKVAVEQKKQAIIQQRMAQEQQQKAQEQQRRIEELKKAQEQRNSQQLNKVQGTSQPEEPQIIETKTIMNIVGFVIM
jgi:hypothetical protein